MSQPNNPQVPGQSGVPAQGQPGYPQQPQAAYPQEPQPGYPQQPQGAYPGQPGYPQTGSYQPQGGYPTGGGQPPGGRASSSKILLIVIGFVVLLVLAGTVLLMMSNRQTPTDPVDPQPSPVPTATTEPTDEPTGEPTATEPPTTEPTDEPTTSPGGSLVDLGNGVKFFVVDGWDIDEQTSSAISVSDGKAVLVTRVVQQQEDTNAGQLCDAYNRQVLANSAGAKFGDAKDVDVKLKNLAVAQCPAAFISTSNGKSTQMAVVTFASVRTTDGVATLSTILFTKNTPDSSFTDADKMLGVVLTTQSVG